MCLSCEHVYVYTSWCKTCTLCGSESYHLALDTYNVFSAPLERGYSRVQRFKMKVDKLLALHSGPNCADPIWKYLDSRKLFLNTPFDVRQCIRRSKLKLKHYDCVRIFTDTFTNFKISNSGRRHSSTLTHKKKLLQLFEKLHHSWMQGVGPSGSFFSYDWVLRHFLEKENSPLVVYLKPKTCRQRDLKYKTRLHDFEKVVELRVMCSKNSVLWVRDAV